MCDKINITTERLKKLIEKTGQTREFIANSIGCDTSMVTKHYNGSRNITVDYVVKYAKHFGVSTDYLLGVSAAQTNDKDIEYICDYIGLSVGAVEVLHDCTEDFLPFYEVFPNYENYLEAKNENSPLLTDEQWEEVKEYLMSINNKSILFILDELLTTANVDFRELVKCITMYFDKKQNLKKNDELLIKIQEGKYINEEFNMLVENKVELDKELCEFLLFKTSKNIRQIADLIYDNYIEFRGADNGNS